MGKELSDLVKTTTLKSGLRITTIRFGGPKEYVGPCVGPCSTSTPFPRKLKENDTYANNFNQFFKQYDSVFNRLYVAS